MKTFRWLLVVAALVVAVSVLAAPAVPPTLNTLHLPDLAGPKLLPLIGHQIIVDGYYADVSIPMIVDDYRRLSYCPIEPPGTYLPIVGQIPANVHAGDHIHWTVNVRAPLATDPVHVRRLPAVLEAVVPAGTATRLAAAQPPLALSLHFTPPAQSTADTYGHTARGTRYAVLLGGGYDAGSNFNCFWNDMQAMYNVLIACNYQPTNIYVLYWDGTPLTGGMPVNYADTSANVHTVFQQLAGKMTANDSLYVQLSCHGGGFLKETEGSEHWGLYAGRWDNSDHELDAVSEPHYATDLNNNGNQTDVLGVDECLGMGDGSGFFDKDFATDVNLIHNYSRMVFVMNQCFASGFIQDLKGSNRLLISDTTENKCGHCDPNGYTHFFYQFIAALCWCYPDTGKAVNADTNHDNKISMEEAYLFARKQVASEEGPRYCDDTSGTPVAIPGQGNSQGAFGKTLFLPF